MTPHILTDDELREIEEENNRRGYPRPATCALLASHRELSKRLEWYESGETHSCHAKCQRPICVIARERNRLRVAAMAVALELEACLSYDPLVDGNKLKARHAIASQALAAFRQALDAARGEKGWAGDDGTVA